MRQSLTCEKNIHIDLLYTVIENKKKQKPKYVKIQDKQQQKQKTSAELANQAGTRLRDIPRANESDLFQSLIEDSIGRLYFSLKIRMRNMLFFI